MKLNAITATMLLMATTAAAQVKTTVTAFQQTGPYAVAAPIAADTVDLQGRKFDANTLLSALPLQAEPQAVFSGSVLPSLTDSKSVGVLTFYVNNSDYVKGKIKVKGPKNYKLYIDGTESGEELKLAARVQTINALSAHADKNGLMDWFDGVKGDVRQVFAVHGEPEKVSAMVELVKEHGVFNAVAPEPGQTFVI